MTFEEQIALYLGREPRVAATAYIAPGAFVAKRAMRYLRPSRRARLRQSTSAPCTSRQTKARNSPSRSAMSRSKSGRCTGLPPAPVTGPSATGALTTDIRITELDLADPVEPAIRVFSVEAADALAELKDEVAGD